MMVPLIPENAPFSLEQRSWLNGFFAGLFSAANGQAAPAALSPEEEDHPWHDSALSLDERIKLAEGKSLKNRMMAAMAQLDCGTCGYLCQTYSEALASGKEKDHTLCQPGGKPTASKLKELCLLRTEEISPTPAAAIHGANGHMANGQVNGFNRDNPFPAPLLLNRPLNLAGSAKDTRLISVDISGSGMQYRAGDSLGIYPRNCHELVTCLLKELGFHGGEPVRAPDGRAVPLREALTRFLDIESFGDELLELLIRSATVTSQIEDLQRLLKEETVAGVPENPGVVELVRHFSSARPSPDDLALALKRLKPRLYSIASSPVVFPAEVHLTVGMVRYEHNGRLRKGVASTYLGDRVRGHEPVDVYIQKSHGFALPRQHEAPMIMVGPGTGIAPFRAFLQERHHLGAKGKNWLFFGDQRRDFDFLYQQELQALLEAGTLHRLDTAFSRDGQNKVYVQDRMRENAKELFAWMEEGGHFYVCGDASRMAKDVDAALREIISNQGGKDTEATAKYMAELSRSGRYQRDVY
ncbi:MAG: sulfite reductase subunit alpha [Gemmataceae bacterium]|nr:sulfite reductase subunit alpha [Gemmataceae bacterium]